MAPLVTSAVLKVIVDLYFPRVALSVDSELLLKRSEINLNQDVPL